MNEKQVRLLQSGIAGIIFLVIIHFFDKFAFPDSPMSLVAKVIATIAYVVFMYYMLGRKKKSRPSS